MAKKKVATKRTAAKKPAAKKKPTEKPVVGWGPFKGPFAKVIKTGT